MRPIDVENVAEFPAPARDRNEDATAAGERELLAAIRSGDRAAAEELVERTYGAVFASLVRLCADTDLAADLTQETYQKAWQALPRFDARSQIFTWLYRIAYTTFLTYLRRPRRTVAIDEPGTREIRDRQPLAEDTIVADEDSERLRGAVLKLPDDLRFTVTAHYWGGLSVREIAGIESITTVAVRKRLHRAFSMLEAMIEEEAP